MSPTRIGSIGLLVLMILAVLNLSPTEVSSMFPLGFSVGMPGESRVEDRHLHLRLSTLPAVEADQNLPRLVIDVGDVAVRSIEDDLLVLSSLSRCSRRMVVSVSRWRAKSSSWSASVRVVRFDDFVSESCRCRSEAGRPWSRACRRSSSCFFCSASDSAWLSSAALV